MQFLPRGSTETLVETIHLEATSSEGIKIIDPGLATGPLGQSTLPTQHHNSAQLCGTTVMFYNVKSSFG